MTGKYIDFKGKLKVGDRVRDAGKDLACNILADNKAHAVTMISETGVYIEGCYHDWKEPGTLELLSPSPRVVTLEGLQPGDEIKAGQDTYVCVDVTKNGKVVFLEEKYKPRSGMLQLMTEAIKERGWQPVQPASPPAPAEKEEEWWREYQTVGVVGERRQWVVDESDIKQLIASAKRRGAEEERKKQARSCGGTAGMGAKPSGTMGTNGNASGKYPCI